MVTIYAVWCDANGKHYIGCTAGKPQKRWREHRCLLRAGKHSSRTMQADWKQHGERSFHLKPYVDALYWDESVESKRKMELQWMEHFAAQGLLYNENRVSFAPPCGASAAAAKARVRNGFRYSEETNLKRRLAQLGKPKKRTRDSLLCSEDKLQAPDKEPVR